MKDLVIDGSVVLKWYLSDEEYCEKALDILEGYISGYFHLHAPALLEFEVANGLVIAKRRGRVDDTVILKAVEGFVELDIMLHTLSSLLGKVLDYSDRYNISAYDAAYVALADELDSRLVTADRRLFNSIRKLGFVKWIGEFKR